MLGDKYGMTTHRGLFPVVRDGSRCQAFADKIFRMPTYSIHPLLVNILKIDRLQAETASEIRTGKPPEQTGKITFHLLPFRHTSLISIGSIE